MMAGGQGPGWRPWGSVCGLMLIGLAVMSTSAPKPSSLAMTKGITFGAMHMLVEVNI